MGIEPSDFMGIMAGNIQTTVLDLIPIERSMFMVKTSIFKFAIAILVTGYTLSLKAWSHDGIPLSEYSKSKSAQELISPSKIYPSLERIFEAHSDGGVDSSYLQLFQGSGITPAIFFDYVVFYTCINALLSSVSVEQPTLQEIETQRIECKEYLGDHKLTNSLYESVMKKSESNRYKAAVSKFMDFLKTHQNVFDIHDRIEF